MCIECIPFLEYLILTIKTTRCLFRCGHFMHGKAALVLVFMLPAVTAPWKEDATAPDTTSEGSEPDPGQ